MVVSHTLTDRREPTRPLPERPIAWLTGLMLLLSLVPLTAQESPRPEERTRIGITAVSADASREDLATLSRVEASVSNILVQSHREALFVSGAAARLIQEGEPNLEEADQLLLDLLLIITLGERASEEEFAVTLELHDVRGESLLASSQTTVSVGRLGRYLRSSSWETLVESLGPFIREYRPFTEVTVLTEPGAQVRWSQGAVRAGSDGVAVVRLRNMRSYTLVGSAEGFRDRTTLLFVPRDPVEVDLDLLRYPRWMVEFSLSDLSFPRVAGGKFLRETSLYLYGELTSRAIGFTPLRQINSAYDESPKLFTFFPVSELALGADLFLSDRDRLLRTSLGVQLIGRLIHADYYVGLDPVLPAAAALRLGWQRELDEHWFLTANLDSRFYYVHRPAFFGSYDMFYALGSSPITWQPVTFSIGGRYAP